MSIEIVIYPPDAKREDLARHVRSLGFSKCKHLWQWAPKALHFQWFELRDFESTDGVELTIFTPAPDERDKFGGGDWAVHTRTRAGASYFDRIKQNEVIRSVRSTFGGTFFNDWYGRNRYTKVESDGKDAAGRGIWSLYESVRWRVASVKYSLPEAAFRLDGSSDIATAIERSDPSRVLYNAMLPFCVAAIEQFFSRSFAILLRYSSQGQSRLRDSQRKVEFQDARALTAGTKSIEEVVAGWYSFQNIDGIHKAYSEWLDIDIWGLLRRRKRVGARVLSLDAALADLIRARHGVVHRFEFNDDLDQTTMTELLDSVLVMIDVLVDYLERRGTKIRD